MNKPKYEVKRGDDNWEACQKAWPLTVGWLRYVLADGTRELARPGNWRVY